MVGHSLVLPGQPPPQTSDPPHHSFPHYHSSAGARRNMVLLAVGWWRKRRALTSADCVHWVQNESRMCRTLPPTTLCYLIGGVRVINWTIRIHHTYNPQPHSIAICHAATPVTESIQLCDARCSDKPSCLIKHLLSTLPGMNATMNI